MDQLDTLWMWQGVLFSLGVAAASFFLGPSHHVAKRVESSKKGYVEVSAILQSHLKSLGEGVP